MSFDDVLIPGSSLGPLGSEAELEAFALLKQRLPRIAERLETEEDFDHTFVVIPSVTVNQEELAKIQGAVFYEERLLFFLIRLTNPAARMVYVTSQPIHPTVMEYYLQHIPGVPRQHALNRLMVLCLYDGSNRPLTQKILERPRVIARIRQFVGDADRAYVTCYNSTPLERRLAVELGLPLNAADPELLELGTKSGSRRVFLSAGVEHPAGFGDLHGEDEIIHSLSELYRLGDGVPAAMVKLNDGFAGEGNALFTYPPNLSKEEGQRKEEIRAALKQLQWSGETETYGAFLRKFAEMGGVVEERVVGQNIKSPSVQMRIDPVQGVRILSSHDQVLGGPTGQAYVGCRFPADDAYRDLIQERAMRVGESLVNRGVIGRFGVDFLTTRAEGGSVACHAIEINLRMGGTTPPFMALEFLTGGGVDQETGLFMSPHGSPKYYYATDNLKSAAYVGLLPDDLMDLLVDHRLQFRHSTQTGVLFHMIGGLSQYGKLGVTAIGNTREEADHLYDATVGILNRETGGTCESSVPRTLFRDPAARID